MQTIIITLGKAYYNQGFFNIPKQYDYLFNNDKTPISIQLGSPSENIITGYINKTANRNFAPRIMCGINYTNWVQGEYKQGDSMVIEVINKDLIRLRNLP
ncbi:hypothetical protein [Pedobacter psychroterrae]|uniref:Uncharacterized protein n=1 Tax=Pedobacter psychroterrae TaxID=2530453 RepID=A0A4R0NKZ0_9SPHI|nr:hypothetical protein [Pedobacter psychroterrae]TCC99973.1 hypothetical protein EZ437_17185 [Pedobacter psychroterrae]